MKENSTKVKIIETMYSLVAENGYDKSSIGQIADLIGIKKASIYYYFKSKEEIFLEMVKEIYKEYYLEVEDIFDKNMDPQKYKRELIALGYTFIDSYFENSSLRKVYAEIDIQTTRIPALNEFVKASDNELKQFFVKCIQQGICIQAFPDDFNIELNAQILYTIMVGIDNAILYDLPLDPKTVWEETVNRLFYRTKGVS